MQFDQAASATPIGPDGSVAGAPPARWLPAARIAWVVVALASLTTFALGVAPEYHTLLQVGAETRRSLAQTGLTPQAAALIHVVFDLVFVAVFTGVGWLIYLRRPTDPVALLTALALVVWGPNNGSLVGADAGPTATAIVPLDMLAGLGGILAYGSWVLFFYLFPSGHFVPRWTRFFAVAWVITAFFWASPIGPPQWPILPARALTLVLWGSFPASQLYRYVRASTPTERLQTKWVVFGIVVGTIGHQLLDAPFPELIGVPASNAVTSLVVDGLQHLVVALVPISIGIAILKYRLFEIDLIINRTLVYGGLTALVVGGYILIVGYLGTAFQARGSLALSLLATGIVAVLFQPARQWLQEGVNHLLYGDRDDPYAAIARLGRQLEGALAPDAILPTVAATIKEALKLPYAAIALPDQGRVAAVGEPRGEVLRLPLVHAGAPVGALLLSPRAPGEGWTPAERRLLNDLAHSAGVAVEVMRLTGELQHSRERLVLAREEERRRLRRDLHDELAPSLAALALTAATAVDLIPPEATRARRLVEELQQALRTSVGEVRRLAHDLRPPTLDELGLVAAIRERAEQVTGTGSIGGLQVQVEAPETVPPLPAAAEVAAYRIVQEALMNVLRHAEAQHCVIRLAVAVGDMGPVLEVSVTDDGIGLPARDDGKGPGVGRRSMQERAAELGGACSIERCEERGTQVRAILPIGTAPEGVADGSLAGAHR